MEQVTFNPWRVNKQGIVIIPSYIYWRKPLMLYRRGNTVKITCNTDIEFNHNGLCYNSNNDVLYWPNFKNFDDIPKGYISGLDCEGTPAFAHVTETRVLKDETEFYKKHKYNIQPLKLQVVKNYFEEMVNQTKDIIIWDITNNLQF